MSTEDYHFRARHVDKKFGYVWRDVTDLDEALQLSAEGNVILKLMDKRKLRLTAERYPKYAAYKSKAATTTRAISGTPPSVLPQTGSSGKSDPTAASSEAAAGVSKKRTQEIKRREEGGGRSTPEVDDGMTPEQRAQLRIRERERLEAEERERKVQGVREAEKQREAAQAAKSDAWTELRGQLTQWQGGSEAGRKPVRALLSSLHTVLWEGANWTPVTVLVRPNEVKIAYRKAMLVVHPDKVPSDAPPRVQVIAKFLFENLNAAYEKFEQAEM